MPAVSGEGGGGGGAGSGAGGPSRSPETGDDLGTMDEVKVFKDEGEDENEQNASESLQAELLEEKSSLLAESEQVRLNDFMFYYFFIEMIKCELNSNPELATKCNFIYVHVRI